MEMGRGEKMRRGEGKGEGVGRGKGRKYCTRTTHDGR